MKITGTQTNEIPIQLLTVQLFFKVTESCHLSTGALHLNAQVLSTWLKKDTKRCKKKNGGEKNHFLLQIVTLSFHETAKAHLVLTNYVLRKHHTSMYHSCKTINKYLLKNRKSGVKETRGYTQTPGLIKSLCLVTKLRKNTTNSEGFYTTKIHGLWIPLAFLVWLLWH